VTRVTRKDVDARLHLVNGAFRNGCRIEVQGRNGYVALDLYDGPSCLTNLYNGTTREVYDWLGGAQEALSILHRRASSYPA